MMFSASLLVSHLTIFSHFHAPAVAVAVAFGVVYPKPAASFVVSSDGTCVCSGASTAPQHFAFTVDGVRDVRSTADWHADCHARAGSLAKPSALASEAHVDFGEDERSSSRTSVRFFAGPLLSSATRTASASSRRLSLDALHTTPSRGSRVMIAPRRLPCVNLETLRSVLCEDSSLVTTDGSELRVSWFDEYARLKQGVELQAHVVSAKKSATCDAVLMPVHFCAMRRSTRECGFSGLVVGGDR